MANDNIATTATAAMSIAGMMTTKPPRPYTEYTMFYQLEREYIIHRILATDEERNGTNDDYDSALSPGSIDSNGNQAALFENDPLMPARYRTLPLRADWYISGKTKKPTKRKHRKTHGKIGFLELTRMIAARWAQVDDETRKYCKMMAAMELVKYKEDMECYNQYKDRLSAMGEIPEDMKERMLKKQRQAEKKEAERYKETQAAADAPPPPRHIQADDVGSFAIQPTMFNAAVKFEPFAHDSPIQQVGSLAISSTRCNAVVKLEPFAHHSPIQRLDSSIKNEMDEFISSLIDSPNRPSVAKVITPERTSSNRCRNLFRGRPAIVTSAAEPSMPGAPSTTNFDEYLVPLGNGNSLDVNLDGINMTFSGFDETEMVREFSDHIHRSTPKSTPQGTSRKMAPPASSLGTRTLEPSFDYWDQLVGNP